MNVTESNISRSNSDAQIMFLKLNNTSTELSVSIFQISNFPMVMDPKNELIFAEESKLVFSNEGK